MGDMVKIRGPRHGEDARAGAGHDRSPEAVLFNARRENHKGNGKGNKGNSTPPNSQRHLQLSCLASHPIEPWLVAGIGNGELAVYKLFRAHGERRPSLHQIQGFDASRDCEDIATALYVPPEPLAHEGPLRHKSFIAGFRSGRVAVFEVKNYVDKEAPVLLDMKDIHKSHVLYVTWHMSQGILSVAADGTALVADTAGQLVWSIHETVGPNAMIVSADVASEREQLAVAGSRSVSLWQCLSQTHYGTLDAFKVPRSPVHHVRYSPSQHFLITVHEGGGTTLVWQAGRLELFKVLWCPSSALMLPQGKTSCAVWVSKWFHRDGAFLIFGPEGVTERYVQELSSGVTMTRTNSAHEQR